MLLPEGSNEKLIKMLIGIFFLSVLLTPLLSGKSFDVSMIKVSEEKPSGELENLQKTVYAELIKVSENAMKGKIDEILKKNEINNAKIIINIDTNADKRIDISQIDIFINQIDAVKTLFAKDDIRLEFNLETNFHITNVGEGGTDDEK